MKRPCGYIPFALRLKQENHTMSVLTALATFIGYVVMSCMAGLLFLVVIEAIPARIKRRRRSSHFTTVNHVRKD